ncbi:hypothetical protein CEE45_00380 [Candidatus Heimdallarchaeota archaeon B3_Heim]|nr:MAG: hypothetical protein CEE45_00380 [Candidatus Heimdallarchaeota archaeon B3_Heim]
MAYKEKVSINVILGGSLLPTHRQQQNTSEEMLRALKYFRHRDQTDKIADRIYEISAYQGVYRGQLSLFIKLFPFTEQDTALDVIERLIILHRREIWDYCQDAVIQIENIMNKEKKNEKPLLGIIKKGEKLKSGDLLLNYISGNCDLDYRQFDEKTKLQENDSIFFIEDSIGSGNQIKTYLTDLINKRGIGNRLKVKIYIITLYGYKQGIKNIKSNFKRNFVNVISFKELDDNSKLLSFFKDEELKNVKEFVQKYGNKKCALGFNNSQSIVVFPDRCSNNVPHFLWRDKPPRILDDKVKGKWRPLFLRYKTP